MRKIIGSLILLFIIAIFVSPAIVGQYAKYNIKHELTTANFSEGMSVKILDYQAGWFQSHAKIQLTLSDKGFLQKYLHAQQQASADNDTIVFSVKLDHGPLTYTTTADGKKQWFFGQAVIKGNTENFPAQLGIYALLHFNNNLDVKYKLTKLKLDIPAKKGKDTSKTHSTQGSINASTGKITLRDSFKKAKIETEVDQINFSHGDMAINLGKIIFTSTAHKSPLGYWVGEHNINIPLITIKSTRDDSDASIALENINLHSRINNDPKTQSVSMEYNASLQKISAHAYQPIGPLTIKFSSRGINPKTFAELRKMAIKLQQSPKQKQSSKLRYLPFLEQEIYLLQGIHANLAIRQTTPQGNIDLNVKIVFPEQAKSAFQGHKDNFMMVLMNLILNTQGQANIQIPEQSIKYLSANLTKKDKDDLIKTIKKWKSAGILQEENNLGSIPVSKNLIVNGPKSCFACAVTFCNEALYSMLNVCVLGSLFIRESKFILSSISKSFFESCCVDCIVIRGILMLFSPTQ